ncbi:hypothetical protein MROS_0730 [Melioribacter roseus P3M-2]|uniref:Uncharacterized protein n=1 Tax=Melioribacter roseus (strain DSM 23840 / JCM 17771 / VKM B-2668 / P3M-2) TaxID=1191523 RepID=I6YTX7_MELRP|nr:hypothetical protein [Melioribacter roseus]AFN73972.1 hypothetical protein MROS_0730 [Melioribacter roseus P3M-2]
MKVNFRTLTGMLLFIAGSLQVADVYTSINFYDSAITIVIALYGISVNYLSLKTNNRRTMLFAVFVFLFSILTFSLKYYGIRLNAEVIIFSGMFSMSSILLVLYIDNPKERIFFYGFIIGAVTTVGAYFLLQFAYVNNLAVKGVGYAIKILPAVLIAGGIGLFLKRERFD